MTYFNKLLIWKKKSFYLATCFLLPAPASRSSHSSCGTSRLSGVQPLRSISLQPHIGCVTSTDSFKGRSRPDSFFLFFSLHPASSNKLSPLRLMFSFWASATVNMLHSAQQHAGFFLLTAAASRSLSSQIFRSTLIRVEAVS